METSPVVGYDQVRGKVTSSLVEFIEQALLGNDGALLNTIRGIAIKRQALHTRALVDSEMLERLCDEALKKLEEKVEV